MFPRKMNRPRVIGEGEIINVSQMRTLEKRPRSQPLNWTYYNASATMVTKDACNNCDDCSEEKDKSKSKKMKTENDKYDDSTSSSDSESENGGVTMEKGTYSEENPCWKGYKRVKSRKEFEKGSCEKA